MIVLHEDVEEHENDADENNYAVKDVPGVLHVHAPVRNYMQHQLDNEERQQAEFAHLEVNLLLAEECVDEGKVEDNENGVEDDHQHHEDVGGFGSQQHGKYKAFTLDAILFELRRVHKQDV